MLQMAMGKGGIRAKIKKLLDQRTHEHEYPEVDSMAISNDRPCKLKPVSTNGPCVSFGERLAENPWHHCKQTNKRYKQR